MLSIIIPTLNEEKYIPNLMVNLAEQDYKNFEVIVVDGVSCDLTRDTVRTVAANLGLNLKFIQAGSANASRQRNIGSKAALGDKLIFIDADIVIPGKGFLSKINHVLYHHASAAVPVKVNPEEQTMVDSIVSDFLNGWMMLLNSIGIPNGRGAVIGARKKEFLRTGGFNENMAVAEDVDLFRKLGRFGRPGILRSAVYESSRRYRRTGYLKLISSWTINGIWSFIFKRSLAREWKDIR